MLINTDCLKGIVCDHMRSAEVHVISVKFSNLQTRCVGGIQELESNEDSNSKKSFRQSHMEH